MCNYAPFLQQLEENDINHRVGKNGKVYLLEKLPSDVAELPADLIPAPVLRLFEQYVRGELNHEALDAPKLHDVKMRLRRYNLIPPVARLSPEEWRRRNAEYLRQWRRDKKRSRPSPFVSVVSGVRSSSVC